MQDMTKEPRILEKDVYGVPGSKAYAKIGYIGLTESYTKNGMNMDINLLSTPPKMVRKKEDTYQAAPVPQLIPVDLPQDAGERQTAAVRLPFIGIRKPMTIVISAGCPAGKLSLILSTTQLRICSLLSTARAAGQNGGISVLQTARRKVTQS